MTAASNTTIGYYGFTQAERSPRLLSGILEFRREGSRFDLYHFLIDVLKTFENRGEPPWKGRVDGILIGTFIGGADAIEWVHSGGVPAVAMASNIIDPRYPAVMVDPASIVRLAMRELLRCRCRSVLFVGFAPSPGSHRRAEAMERAAKGSGLRFARLDTEWVFSEAAPEDAAENRELAKLLAKLPKPVGVHTLNDPIGRRVQRICEEVNLKVPEQVAIVSADDTPLAFERRPTLTSVCDPGEAVGFRAAQALLAMLSGGRPPRKPIFVPATKIAVRESTGGLPEFDEVVRALEVIRRKATFGLKVQELADSLGVNRRTLERAFRERLGRSPAFEIHRLRMITARQLLSETKLSVSQIGAMIGYAETAAFSNAFHKEMGISPREFRRQPLLGPATTAISTD